MRVLSLFALILVVLVQLGLCAKFDSSIIEQVNNNKEAKWKATTNKFTDMSIEDIKKMLGTQVQAVPDMEIADIEILNDLPDHFDAAEKWPGCVHKVRDQGHCGSCWAHGATEALSDRFCIAGVDVVLSPQDMVSCDKTNMGCNGGRLNTAWSYMVKHGVVTEECFPYVSGNGTSPSCPTKCVDGTPFSSAKYYAKDYKHVGSVIFPAKRVQEIQTAIMTSGPVEAAFMVYEDFLTYKEGVYHHVSGKLLGGHAIKVTGWGTTSDGTPYWIIQNSWGPAWGIDGFFWMLRGKDECIIESEVYAGTPKI